MFYRVDYTLAVMIAGLVVGTLFSARFARIPPSRAARTYYVCMAVLVVLRTAFFAFTLLAIAPRFGTIAAGVLGDLLGFLFGAIFGLAVRRQNARELLLDRSVLAAISMMIAFTFAVAAVGKAFDMDPMTQFFNQSGYSADFLKFIVIAEIFGALGLLLPWSFFPALVGLSIDMFGAVATHVHNGDPLNDSTGAIGLLIRLAALGVLWTLRPRAGRPDRTVRSSLAISAATAIVCLLVAVAGSIVLRHLSPPATIPASSR